MLNQFTINITKMLIVTLFSLTKIIREILLLTLLFPFTFVLVNPYEKIARSLPCLRGFDFQHLPFHLKLHPPPYPLAERSFVASTFPPCFLPILFTILPAVLLFISLGVFPLNYTPSLQIYTLI